MKMKLTALVIAALSVASPVAAQTASDISVQYAGSIARTCLADWQAQSCLAAVSESNLALLSNYGADLKSRNLEAAAENLKQHCAATTAASQQEVPAYAMKSALTECANTILEITQETGIQPDASHYQLLIAPLLCLSADPRCDAISEQLKVYAK